MDFDVLNRQAYDNSDMQSFFSGQSKFTKKTLWATSGVFGGLLLIGIVSELIYTRLWKSTRKVQNREGKDSSVSSWSRNNGNGPTKGPSKTNTFN